MLVGILQDLSKVLILPDSQTGWRFCAIPPFSRRAIHMLLDLERDILLQAKTKSSLSMPQPLQPLF